jgi:hypothetical protein
MVRWIKLYYTGRNLKFDSGIFTKKIVASPTTIATYMPANTRQNAFLKGIYVPRVTMFKTKEKQNKCRTNIILTHIQ